MPLEYAAEQGVVAAQWKLGRMYAEGDGVEQSDISAFEYFSRIADAHADDSPDRPQARFVANAFVALGHYYRDGIPDSDVKADLGRAREMFAYAASYFGDPDAQYHLGRLLLDGNGTDRSAAGRALAQRGRQQGPASGAGGARPHAVQGRGRLPRQAARGLMWLTLARDNAGASDTWIGDLYDAALKQASTTSARGAADMLARWVKRRRE